MYVTLGGHCCYEGVFLLHKSNLSIQPTPSCNLSLVTGWGWCCGVGSWCLQAVCLQTPYYQAVFMQCSCSVHAVFRQCSGSVQTPSQPGMATQNKHHHTVVVRWLFSTLVLPFYTRHIACKIQARMACSLACFMQCSGILPAKVMLRQSLQKVISSLRQFGVF